MNDPVWLNRERVELIHQQSIEIAGGSHGLRDSGLLDSALARPHNLHAYGENDIFQLAASYAEGLSRNHAFVDGNKRVAFTSAGIFLRDNGYELLPSKGDQHADMIEGLAQGHVSREQAAQHFKDNCRAIEREKTTTRDELPKKDWSKKPRVVKRFMEALYRRFCKTPASIARASKAVLATEVAAAVFERQSNIAVSSRF